jgi:hypothetical protein
MSESSPPFRSAQANLSAPWMAPARRPMLQQGLKCFKEKIKKQKKLVGGFVAFQSPCLHGGAIVHDGSVRGGGGCSVLRYFILFIYIYILFYFIYFIFFP